jgi:hypothetical protein
MSSEPQGTPVYVDVNGLLERGWSRALIKKYLGREDSSERVNHWANHRGKSLYRLSRVEAAEHSPEVKSALQRIKLRRHHS